MGQYRADGGRMHLFVTDTGVPSKTWRSTARSDRRASFSRYQFLSLPFRIGPA